jgi:hypothetical protein
MNEEFKYYFIPNIFIDDQSNLFKPFRIVKLNVNFPVQPNGITGYNSLKELRRNDNNWKSYHEKDPKSAVKICQEEFLITAKDFILTPSDAEFNKVSFKLLKHNLMGELSNEILGIHLYSKLNKNIKSIEKLQIEDKRGVWVARIEYYSEERDKIFIKDNSSMFPISWDPTTYMFEIFHAYKTRRQNEFDEYRYDSTTLSGIPVSFIIKEGILKTVYPIYDSENN